MHENVNTSVKVRYCLVLLPADKVKDLDDVARLAQSGELEKLIIRKEEWEETE